MSRRKNVLMVTTGILIGILMAGTAAHAAEAPPIRVSSYKGAVLEVGERSGLVIGPSGAAYTVTSSDPDTVAVEQVMSCWPLPSPRGAWRSPPPTRPGKPAP